jgi:hypothetical protein
MLFTNCPLHVRHTNRSAMTVSPRARRCQTECDSTASLGACSDAPPAPWWINSALTGTDNECHQAGMDPAKAAFHVRQRSFHRSQLQFATDSSSCLCEPVEPTARSEDGSQRALRSRVLQHTDAAQMRRPQTRGEGIWGAELWRGSGIGQQHNTNRSTKLSAVFVLARAPHIVYPVVLQRYTHIHVHTTTGRMVTNRKVVTPQGIGGDTHKTSQQGRHCGRAQTKNLASHPCPLRWR